MLFRSDRKSTRLNSSHTIISYAVFCLKKKTPARARTQVRHLAFDSSPASDERVARCAVGVGWRAAPGGGRGVAGVALFVFFFNDTATTEIYTLSLHDALPI